MTEAFGSTSIHVGSNAHGNHIASLSEETTDGVLSGAETNVSTENAGGFTSNALGSGALSAGLVSTTGEFDADSATAVSGQVFSSESGSGLLMSLILNESNASRLAIAHDELALGQSAVSLED